MNKYIKIKSSKFTVDAEDDGGVQHEPAKLLASYLKDNLQKRQYAVQDPCAQDETWWIEIKSSTTLGLFIQSAPENDIFAVSNNLKDELLWSFGKMAWLDYGVLGAELMGEVEDIFRRDPDVVMLSVTEEPPFSR